MNRGSRIRSPLGYDHLSDTSSGCVSGMEVNVRAIEDPHETAPERLLRSLLVVQECLAPQTNVRRQSASHRFSLHALRSDDRRAGKTAKLIDLCARLKCGVL